MSLEVRDAVVRYPRAGRAALNGVSFALAPGELVTVAGANGCGKSTLCHLLAGARPPDAGAVLLDAEPLDMPAPARIQLVQQSIDDHVVAPQVREDIAFGPECLGLTEAEVAARVREALATVGLAHLAERETTTLSGGELARIALAGALAMHPAYLLLDEPGAHLDAATAEELVRLLRSIADAGTGVLFVTHRLEEARLADRLVVMRAGAIAAQGSPRELLYDRLLLERCGLHPPAVAAFVEAWRSEGRTVAGAPLSLEELVDAGTAGTAGAAGAGRWPASV